MAWTDISAACGHTYREQMYGPHRGRESRASYLEGRDCPDCWKEKRDKENAEKAAHAAVENGDLPQLIGSVKQVPWAETIRAEKVKQLRALQERLAGGTNSEKVAKAREIIQKRLDNNSAQFWIDNRTVQYDQEWLITRTNKEMAPISL